MTISTTTNTPAAVYSLIVSASDSINTHTVPLTLVVDPIGDFSVAVSPLSQSVIEGSNTGYGITVGSLNGFTDVVALTVSGLPAGATGVISPNSVAGSGNTQLTINTSTTTPAGSYTLTITGTSGPVVHTATTTLVVSRA